MPQNYQKADLILLFVTLIAGTGWIFTSEALAGFQPLTFMGTRFLLAGFVLSLFGLKQFRCLSLRQNESGGYGRLIIQFYYGALD